MQKINKNTMTIKIIIPYQQWMKYGEDKCMGCRKKRVWGHLLCHGYIVPVKHKTI